MLLAVLSAAGLAAQLMEFSKYSAEFLANNRKHVLYLMSREGRKDREDVFAVASNQTISELVFVLVTTKFQNYLGLADFMGKGHEEDVSMIITADEHKFLFKGDLDRWEDYRDFAYGFGNGTLPQYFKSAPIRAQPEGQLVLEVTGESFEPMLMDTEKEVLLLIYHPRCEHCHDLKRQFERVASRLQDHPNLLVAQFDAGQNQIPHNKIEKVPLVYWMRRGVQAKTHSYLYEGERTADALIEFVRGQTQFEWVQPRDKSVLQVLGQWL